MKLTTHLHLTAEVKNEWSYTSGFFIPCIFYMCYNKNYQQMLLFVLCLYFLFLVLSLHVSGLHGPIIRGITSCCFYATIWFMQCFVDRLRASADWFVVVTSVY